MPFLDESLFELDRIAARAARATLRHKNRQPHGRGDQGIVCLTFFKCPLIGARDSHCPLPGIATLRSVGMLSLTPLGTTCLGRRSVGIGCLRLVTPKHHGISRRPPSAFLGPRPRARHLSTIAITPIPPAVQIEINPRPEPFCASNFASVATMRVPVAANG